MKIERDCDWGRKVQWSWKISQGETCSSLDHQVGCVYSGTRFRQGMLVCLPCASPSGFDLEILVRSQMAPPHARAIGRCDIYKGSQNARRPKG